MILKNIVRFTYTKNPNDISERVGIVLDSPTPHLMMMFDATNLDQQTLNDLADQCTQARRAYLNTLYNLQKQFNTHIKTFKQTGIEYKKD